MDKRFAGRTKSAAPLLFLAVLLIAGTIAAGQEHNNQPIDLSQQYLPVTEERKAQLIKGIMNGETEAILAAGDTHDKTFLPYLRQALKSNVHAHEALAKLGDPEELRSIVCSIANPKLDDFSSHYTFLRILPYVGGWFTLRWYRLALDEELNREFSRKHDRRLKRQPSTEDMGTTGPLGYAVENLPKLFPEDALKAKVTSLEYDAQAKFWREWIDSHKRELQKLEPTGEGISYSGKGCKEPR